MFPLRRRSKKERRSLQLHLHLGPSMSPSRPRHSCTMSLEKAALSSVASRRRRLILEGQRSTEPRPPSSQHQLETGGAALTLKLDGLKLEMNPGEVGGDSLPAWEATLDLDDLRPGRSRHQLCSQKEKRSKSMDLGSSTRLKSAPAPKGPLKGLKMTRMPSTLEEINEFNRHLEAENAEILAQNNLIQVKNEVLLININEKRLGISRMHWEMLEMRESLDTAMEAHFLESRGCHGHHHCHSHSTGNGGGGVASAAVATAAGNGSAVIVEGTSAVAAAAAVVAANTLIPAPGKKKRYKNRLRRRR